MQTHNQHILLEDTLKLLHSLEYESSQPTVPLPQLAAKLNLPEPTTSNLLLTLQSQGLCSLSNSLASLTPAGRLRAREIIRSHRLYESFLAQTTSLPPHEWHAQADRIEHSLSPAQADAIANALNHPRFDPHGDPIPTRSGLLPPFRGTPLPSAPPSTPLQILHIEDEPPDALQICNQLNLAPTSILQILKISDGSIHFTCESRQLSLPLPIAAKILVAPAPTEKSAIESAPLLPLHKLPIGSSATIVALSAACRGPERSRLLDLGFVPGSRVTAEFASPHGSPIAYRIRGTLVALRQAQAQHILVTQNTPPCLL